ncbi:Amino-acid acetyltransferase, mitochondrial [Coemansia javaensis]|uniref:Amino-acid acetyltransferase, mitochondrial n=1 Tax=Coemansia javaensis TaxID=2761396 RepID=A0A9W8HJS5_9FUNG|nr:Amino-acid acetyltransferase, mitochondrial [Coemansia javaensis]
MSIRALGQRGRALGRQGRALGLRIGRAASSSASPKVPDDAAHRQRERDLILSVLSTVPSRREAQRFLKSVSASETMRSQREFEERQAQLAAAQGHAVPGEALRDAPSRARSDAEAVPRRLTAAVFVGGAQAERAGRLLAQIQRIGVAPVVMVAGGGAAAAAADYRDAIRSAHRLADAIEREGGRARPVNEGVFYNSPYARADLTVDPELIGAAVAQGQAPIITPLMADAALQVRVLETAPAAEALARGLALSSSTQHAMAGSGGAFSLLLARLILLGDADGLADGATFHRFVNLEEDHARVAQACAQPDALALMRTCLAILPPTAAGIVASVRSDPSLVLKGLISERPVATQHRSAAQRAAAASAAASAASAATAAAASAPSYRPLPNYPFVNVGPARTQPQPQPQPQPPVEAEPPTRFTLLRHGFRIQRHTRVDACDLPRLRGLLEQSFGRTLDGAYFDRLRGLEAAGGIEVIVAGDYQGAVIVTHEPVPGARPLAYLDKFAVLPAAQGTGMADILWAQLRRACPACMWRSRNDNGVNRWYFDRATGHFRAPPPESGTRWVFFWYHPPAAAPDPDEIRAGIRVAQAIPPSFA